ncbi:MAG: hypothetical protein NTV34_17170 [Proteobacteria bacterium]|nr:hypothetical protein [Pseudomonadota bacterium]
MFSNRISSLSHLSHNQWLRLCSAAEKNTDDYWPPIMEFPLKILNFFSFKAATVSKPLALSPSDIRNRRKQPRYTINCSTECSLSLSNGQVFSVMDLSVSGALLSSQTDFDLNNFSPIQKSTLTVFGQTLTSRISQMQRRGELYVAMFDQSSDDFIIGISSILEPLRCGSCAIEIYKEDDHRVVHSGIQRERFIGDGPFDLVIETSSRGEFLFGMATIRQGPTYGVVIWEAGNVITKRTLDSRGVGARMAQTPKVELEMVAYAGTACLGMTCQGGGSMAAALGKWLRASR